MITKRFLAKTEDAIITLKEELIKLNDPLTNSGFLKGSILKTGIPVLPQINNTR